MVGVDTYSNQGSAVALEAVRYLEQYTKEKGFLSIYSYGSLPAKKSNPFEGEQPFVMDSAQMIYWAFQQAGIEMLGGSEGVNIKKIRRDPRFKVIYTEGQKQLHMINDFKIGDLLFFGSDTSHIGIFVGGCSFITISGSGDWDTTRGIRSLDLTSTYWWSFFNGAVLRWE